jgi:cation diffusion facilitator CzcD-associated flavoprotein CzcO
MPEEHFDVLIVGAGLSGVGAACRLQRKAPDRSYVILEARDRLGGTWDVFRFPGVRSDSDMYTLSYSFRPWREPRAIVDGASILRYLQDTAREFGVDRKIRYGWRVRRAEWSTAESRWRVEAQDAEGRLLKVTCNFLFLCGGYYSHRAGHDPDFPGKARFRGRIIHPQAWPESETCAGQRVVVIGSGATAVTLVPALAQTAAHVVMLQRSPSYVVARPAEDALGPKLARRLPLKLAFALTRLRHLYLQQWFYRLARRKPEAFKAHVIEMARRQLGPDCEVETHFTPSYAPWDQRLCIAPDADLFRAIRSGQASVVTEEVESFTETGVRLASGRELAADIVVTATGLELEAFNGVAISVDGRPIEAAQALGYKGMMYDGVPNLATCLGYTNASWTLRADLTSAYVCRLLNHMRRGGFRQCTPRNRELHMPRRPWIELTSGYVRRALHRLPSQGDRAPWRNDQNYLKDLINLRFYPLDDGVLEFSNRLPAEAAQVQSAVTAAA